MTEMLRRLARDTWVVGIAAAIAIGYAVVRVIAELVAIALRAIDDEGGSGRFVFNVAGRDFAFRELLAATVTLAAVGTLAAWLLARADRE